MISVSNLAKIKILYFVMFILCNLPEYQVGHTHVCDGKMLSRGIPMDRVHLKGVRHSSNSPRGLSALSSVLSGDRFVYGLSKKSLHFIQRLASGFPSPPTRVPEFVPGYISHTVYERDIYCFSRVERFGIPGVFSFPTISWDEYNEFDYMLSVSSLGLFYWRRVDYVSSKSTRGLVGYVLYLAGYSIGSCISAGLTIFLAKCLVICYCFEFLYMFFGCACMTPQILLNVMYQALIKLSPIKARPPIFQARPMCFDRNRLVRMFGKDDLSWIPAIIDIESTFMVLGDGYQLDAVASITDKPMHFGPYFGSRTSVINKLHLDIFCAIPSTPVYQDGWSDYKAYLTDLVDIVTLVVSLIYSPHNVHRLVLATRFVQTKIELRELRRGHYYFFRPSSPPSGHKLEEFCTYTVESLLSLVPSLPDFKNLQVVFQVNDPITQLSSVLGRVEATVSKGASYNVVKAIAGVTTFVAFCFGTLPISVNSYREMLNKLNALQVPLAGEMISGTIYVLRWIIDTGAAIYNGTLFNFSPESVDKWLVQARDILSIKSLDFMMALPSTGAPFTIYEYMSVVDKLLLDGRSFPSIPDKPMAAQVAATIASLA